MNSIRTIPYRQASENHYTGIGQNPPGHEKRILSHMARVAREEPPLVRHPTFQIRRSDGRVYESFKAAVRAAGSTEYAMRLALEHGLELAGARWERILEFESD